MNAAYALLDDPKSWAAFSKPFNSGPSPEAVSSATWESQVVVQGMHCAACALNVEAALCSVPGVKQATVNGATHRAQITWSAQEVRPSQWLDALSRAGYQAVPANDFVSRQAGQAQVRQQLWRWLVAGLCMMQVMMYAWPVYVAAPGDIAPNILSLLKWASWVLTLPVMFFATDVFTMAAWRDLKQGRISMDLPVALGIWVTFIVSSAAVFDPEGLLGSEVYFDSLTMFVFFLLTGRWLETRLRERTAGALEALINRLPQSVQRQTQSGGLETVALHQLRVGDVLQVHPGEVFAADGLLLQGHTWVEEALLTGESEPLERQAGDSLMAGSHNLRETIQMKVLRLGEHTRYAEIVSLMQSASLHKPRLAALADSVAKPFLWAVLLAAALSAAFAWSISPGHALMVAVSVLIVTCPCALSLATPAAMLAAAGQLARQGVLLRNVQSLESLAQVDAVVFDKTGTLTEDRMGLQSLFTPLGDWHLNDDDQALPHELLRLAASLSRHSAHPFSRAVAQLWPHRQDDWPMQAVQEEVGQGVSGRILNDQGQVVRELRLGSASFCQSWRGNCGMPPKALTAQVHLCDENGWLSSFEFQERLRDDAVPSLQALQQQGLKLFILSGDTSAAVDRIAKRLQLPQAQVQARCSPEAKLQFVQNLQAQGLQVAMVGDGFNDMPVLAGAHVSFAFGQAVPLAQARSDVVVQGQHLMLIANTLALAQRTQTVVRHNLMWAATYNALCVPLAFMGYLPPWLAGLGMALSSLIVVLYSLQLAVPPRTNPFEPQRV
jgi:P-type Cu2+ transporter